MGGGRVASSARPAPPRGLGRGRGDIREGAVVGRCLLVSLQRPCRGASVFCASVLPPPRRRLAAGTRRRLPAWSPAGRGVGGPERLPDRGARPALGRRGARVDER